MLVELYYDGIKYDGYFISSDGVLYSNKTGKLKELKPFITSKGYKICVISLGCRANRKHIVIHRAVAYNFIPNVGDYYTEVDHIDTDRTNNNVNNLRWVTRQGNQLNPITRKKKSRALMGNTNGINRHLNGVAKNPSKKATRGKGVSKKVLCIDTGETFNSIVQAAEKYNLEAGNIGRVCNGKRKKCGGYQWRYVVKEVMQDVQLQDL